MRAMSRELKEERAKTAKSRFFYMPTGPKDKYDWIVCDHMATPKVLAKLKHETHAIQLLLLIRANYIRTGTAFICPGIGT